MFPLTCPLLLLPLLLLAPTVLANGCHDGKDKIGCPTVISTDTFTSAIADFCNNHFIRLNQPPLTQSIAVGNSWPGLVYSLPTYEDRWGSKVMFWANFKVDRTSTGDPYVLDYPSCISLLGQASTANGTDHGPYGKGCSYGDGWSFGGWGNTDFGTVFAEAICPSGISCLPWNQRPLGC